MSNQLKGEMVFLLDSLFEMFTLKETVPDLQLQRRDDAGGRTCHAEASSRQPGMEPGGGTAQGGRAPGAVSTK